MRHRSSESAYRQKIKFDVENYCLSWWSKTSTTASQVNACVKKQLQQGPAATPPTDQHGRRRLHHNEQHRYPQRRKPRKLRRGDHQEHATDPVGNRRHSNECGEYLHRFGVALSKDALDDLKNFRRPNPDPLWWKYH